MALPEDIITKIRQDFSEDDGLRVLQMLKDLVAEDSGFFGDRILRCLVVLAAGHVEKFTNTIASARSDVRDVISAAESRIGSSANILSLPFGIYPDLGIFKKWFVGQEILIPWAGNQKWTVELPDIRSLSLKQVRQLKDVNAKISDSNLYVANVSFLCIRGDKEISASKAMDGEVVICYRIDPITSNFEFQQFGYSPKKIGKRGKW
jgi:hypothetical protein